MMKKTVLLMCMLVSVLTGMAQKNDHLEFMLLVHSHKDQMTEMGSEHREKHIQKVGQYIEGLAKSGTLLDAQPLVMDGAVITAIDGKVNQKKLKVSNRAVAGYYKIKAKNLDEAISIAKADPRFEENGWAIEIRPIKKVTGIN